MRTLSHTFELAALVIAISATAALAQTVESMIPSDDGGASGYQHRIERSRFFTGASGVQLRPVEEFGFSKVVGPNGVFATNLRNGLVVATQNNGVDKSEASPQQQDQAKPDYQLNPDKHNAMVMEYFLASGIPREQVGGIHANTYLSGGGASEDAASVRKVDGYASILERVVEGKVPVVESVAWARLGNDGKPITEWVYWPAIPAKVLTDARRLMNGSRGAEYLARLPAGLPAGTVVIHHSSATDEGSFEAMATYDVIDYRGPIPDRITKIPVVRHFDVEGVERRLPSERLNLGAPDPGAK